MVAELVVKHGLGGAVQFVLTGGSAGGMATLNNADYVSELVRAVAPVSVLSATTLRCAKPPTPTPAPPTHPPKKKKKKNMLLF